jgi:hypothetical protein
VTEPDQHVAALYRAHDLPLSAAELAAATAAHPALQADVRALHAVPLARTDGPATAFDPVAAARR